MNRRESLLAINMDNFNPIQRNSVIYNYPQYQNVVVQTDECFLINEMEYQMLDFLRNYNITLQELKYFVKKTNDIRESYHIETEPISDDELEINTFYFRDNLTQRHMIHRFSSFLIKNLIGINNNDLTLPGACDRLAETIRPMLKDFIKDNELYGYIPRKTKSVETNTDLTGPVRRIPAHKIWSSFNTYYSHERKAQKLVYELASGLNKDLLPFYINKFKEILEEKPHIHKIKNINKEQGPHFKGTESNLLGSPAFIRQPEPRLPINTEQTGHQTTPYLIPTIAHRGQPHMDTIYYNRIPEHQVPTTTNMHAREEIYHRLPIRQIEPFHMSRFRSAQCPQQFPLPLVTSNNMRGPRSACNEQMMDSNAISRETTRMNNSNAQWVNSFRPHLYHTGGLYNEASTIPI